ncbi:MAG: hypothetical protein KJ042_17540, partial [Deltaproteobacteria bacterium]|nr:hypothetical protein [Deltaproteobacteria bacterium]
GQSASPSPAMPLPGTAATTDAEPPKPTGLENPFTVLIHNCYLADPSINPIGAPTSREKGVRLVVSGAIRNNSERLIFRAGIFSKLVVNFGTEPSLEKHSPGLGFEPAVTSNDPWRPGTWRTFRIEGRALDPIYREFKPKTITGVLSMEARDPLDFRFANEIERTRPRWDVLFGIPVDMATTTAEEVSIAYGPKAIKKILPKGAAVKIVAQQGGGYLALAQGQYFGWVPEKSLAIRQYESMYAEQPPVNFPLGAQIEGRFALRVLDYRYDVQVAGLPVVEAGYMSFHVEITSLAKQQSLTVKPEFFWVDQGSGRLAEAESKTTAVAGALPPQTNLAPGAAVSGWIYIQRHKDGWPFALVFEPPSSPAAHVHVLGAIGREGRKNGNATTP